MNYNITDIDKFEFLTCFDNNINMYFSTAKGDIDFNKNTEMGLENLVKIRNLLNLKDIGYLNQIHSDLVHFYDGTIKDGDSLITNKQNIAVGVFTADCVPILIYDKNYSIAAAVHSGWKGTYKKIVINTIDKLTSQFNVSPLDLKVFIGPHNMQCCYEIGYEVESLFLNDNLYKDVNIIDNHKLNLQKCIQKQLEFCGVASENVKTANICTFCEKKLKLHSYRKHKKSYGRMFSFIFINNKTMEE